jgi:hypothetical protein
VTSCLKAPRQDGETTAASTEGIARGKINKNRLIEDCVVTLSAEFTMAASPEGSIATAPFRAGGNAFDYRPAVSSRWGVCVTL